MVCEAINNIWFVKVSFKLRINFHCIKLNKTKIKKESSKEKYSINGLKFDQMFKGELPKFDISFGRGKFSKTNNQLTNWVKSSPNGNKLNNSASNGDRSKTSNVKNMTKSKSTTSVNTNTNGFHQQQQRKSLNASASAKLSSKIKKKYSKHSKVIEENKRIVNNGNKLATTVAVVKQEDFCLLAELELKRLESEKLMDMKSKKYKNFIIKFHYSFFHSSYFNE